MAARWLEEHDDPKKHDFDAHLALLPATNLRVKNDLAKIDAGQKLSLILLVHDGVGLEIADGDHEACASHLPTRTPQG